MNRKSTQSTMLFPYVLWLALFVLAPLLLLIYQSLLNIDGQFTFENIVTYFTSATYITMTIQSFIFAGLITAVTLLVSYPAAYVLTLTDHKELWRMLLILPTWINI